MSQLDYILVLDEDKEMAKLLTGYQDMVGLLNVHKVARLNTQVIFLLDIDLFLDDILLVYSSNAHEPAVLNVTSTSNATTVYIHLSSYM
jgi:hypothetical protein